jgi:TetR/AcrR family transcriptional repressor of nem operon
MGRRREFNVHEALNSAVNVFWERGYTDASVQDLCKAMSINPGSLYAAFGTKQDIFRSAIRHYLKTVTKDGMGSMASAETGAAGIRSYFDYIVEGIVTGRRAYGCLGTNSFMELSESDPTIKSLMIEHFQHLEESFRGALARDGFDDPGGLAKYLTCVAQGLNVLARTAPTRTALTEIVENALANLEHANARLQVAAHT